MSVSVAAGHLIPTSPWMRLDPPRNIGDTVAAFDSFGGDEFGIPTGFCASGCSQNNWCPSQPAGARWWGGLNFRSPLSINDMQVAGGFEGRRAIRSQFAWWWEHAAPTRCFVAILTGDSFSTCPTSTPPESGSLGGIVFDMGELSSMGGYWWSDIDVRESGLSWRLPASGSYTIMLGTAYHPGTGVFVVDQSWGTQPMQWGTGERPGSSGPMQWDDWRNANGSIEPNECSYYTDLQHCPLPQGAMLAFWVEENCYANCDQSLTAPLLTANDFQCFINAYASGTSYANCDASTGSPALTANDFQCFLTRFAAGCS